MIYTITLNPAIDRLLFIGEELVKRKTNRISKVTYDLGGKGLHGSYVMSKLKIDNLAMGLCGTNNKAALYDILTEKNIRHEFTEVADESTRECYIVLEEGVSGSTMFTEKGLVVSEFEKRNLLEKVRQKVTSQDMVLIAGSLPQNYLISDLEELLYVLKDSGCFIACDLSGEALLKAVEVGVHFIKPNEFELQEIVSKNQSLTENLEALSERVDCVIASQGEKGSFCQYQGEQFQVIAPKVEEVNDTGAGDCFVGAFLSMFYLKKPIEECLRFASGCAASKVKNNDSTSFDIEDALDLQREVTINRL
ncbi:carbohydrate kinase pfkb [Trichococcus palustris]|jgi:1-phosphofructokinase|uniref:Tagatose-6-phosphate kinase n=1 Tax=Trichococcus palustris TaxID=140314 RepID=A0A143YVE7_9LACT|nr:1-phosphofructokinase family hexose kinase [Trichococcus palustris]CZQ98368.1 carbohydrate kinase pfkb [Trichococcus palustris]SFK94959.1 1-phosphofructokinase [Trichococcus palustris]